MESQAKHRLVDVLQLGKLSLEGLQHLLCNGKVNLATELNKLEKLGMK